MSSTADTRSQPASHTRSEPISAVVVLHVKPGCEAEFLSLLTPVLDAMRHEPTFINATLHRDPDDPTRFMIHETWADPAGPHRGSNSAAVSPGLPRSTACDPA